MEETIGQRISFHRKRLGMTQEQLAEKLNVTAQAVSKWENNQSCPDISVLPQLAQIFGVSTDSLLGHQAEEKPHRNEETSDDDKSYIDLHWNGSRLESIGLACTIAAFGIAYFISLYLKLSNSFWDILWPTALLGFGIFGLYPNFSFLRLGCAIFGGYFLTDCFIAIPFRPKSGMVIAIIIVLFGLALLAESIRKPKEENRAKHRQPKKVYEVQKDSFYYNGSFSEDTVLVDMETLRYGQIKTAFGEYRIDLSGVKKLAADACLEVATSFGELTVLVPKHYRITTSSRTALADFEIEGKPAEITQGTLQLSVKVHLGSMCVKYI